MTSIPAPHSVPEISTEPSGATIAAPSEDPAILKLEEAAPRPRNWREDNAKKKHDRAFNGR